MTKSRKTQSRQAHYQLLVIPLVQYLFHLKFKIADITTCSCSNHLTICAPLFQWPSIGVMTPAERRC